MKSTSNKKRNFGDEVLFFTVHPRHDFFQWWDERNALQTVIYKGKIKGILEMESGSISYMVLGCRHNLYATNQENYGRDEMHQVHSSHCFSDKEELVKEVRRILK